MLFQHFLFKGNYLIKLLVMVIGKLCPFAFTMKTKKINLCKY